MQLSINGKIYTAKDGQTVLDIAKENGIEIPTLCYHPDLTPKASCRLCLVEIKGKRGLYTSCSTKAEDGMEVLTDSPKIIKARKTNLELLVGQHCEKCEGCDKIDKCQLRDLTQKYNIDITKFSDRKVGYPIYKFGPSIIFDSSKCINCKNCVEACQKQSVNFLEVKDKNGFLEVCPTSDPNKDCTYCGQCVLACPVDAMDIKRDTEIVEKELKNKSKKVVFQFAPAIRASIGEEFGMPYGSVVTEKLVAAIKKLGAYKVFDTSVGADFTTMEEAGELVDKITNNKGACLSSCCPAWVKFIEFNYPELIHHLATTRSPQVILGGIIKNYWAKNENINPKEIVNVSIMPCTAKKYEIERKELKINGLKPVDYILTTRELAGLLKKNKIDINKIEEQKADDPLGFPSGAGVIYGASGGVAESALRTAYFKITNNNLQELEIKSLRGINGVKKAEISINGKIVKMAIVNGLGNTKEILEELRKDPNAYAAVEVMACPGGCIGGGGQPVPFENKIREQRAKSLYDIDDKKELRLAHENPIIKKVYEEFLNSEKIIHQICHTKYSQKKKENKF